MDYHQAFHFAIEHLYIFFFVYFQKVGIFFRQPAKEHNLFFGCRFLLKINTTGMVATGHDLQQQLFAETCCIIDQQCQNGLHGTVPKKQRKLWGRNRLMWHSVIRKCLPTWQGNLESSTRLKCILEWIIIKNIFETKFDFRRDKCQTSKIPGCVSGATKWPWLVSDWERIGKSKYAWKSGQFILAISNHTHQANSNSVGFPNRAERN